MSNLTANNGAHAMSLKIGSVTKYIGDAEWQRKGWRVRVCAVLPGCAALGEDFIPTADVVVDNDALAALGGVTERDILEVAWLYSDGRPSKVTSYVRAVEL